MRAVLKGASALVVGSGIIGLSTALELSKAGYSVRLIERGALARESSWAGGGLLSPLYPWQMPPAVWQLAAESQALYPALCAMLAAETGIDPEWTQNGLLMLDEEQIAPGLQWAAARGVVAESIKVSIAAATTRPALHLPWVAQVRNPRLCRALAVYLRQRGVQLLDQIGETRLHTRGSDVVVESAAQSWQADVTVICAGAWTADLLRPLDWTLPIKPIKGQMILLRGTPGLLPQLLLSRGQYLIPRRDGRILVGSTVEDLGYDRTTTSTVAAELRQFAASLLPACRDLPLEAHWAGLRPGTPEGIPRIARHPDLPGLYVNAGQHRYGLTLALSSARQLLGLVAQG